MAEPFPERIPLDAIRQARARIKDSAVRTPLVRLPYDGPREIWLKLEMLQPVGSFKIRGARNAIGAIDRTIYPGAHREGTAIRFESFELWGAD